MASPFSFPADARLLPPRALYSARDTETILSVSHATLYRLIAAGRLDARKIGGKTAITATSIERFLAELPKVGRRA
jgi:excisionase family DNA binding protein